VKRAAIWLLTWGLWLGVLTALQVAFKPKLIQFAIPGLASAACITCGLALWAADRNRRHSEQARLITDSSVATITLTVGVAVTLVGTGFGLWLILIGFGIGGLGFGGIVREQRARGRTLHGGGSR
jgi:hypothetical protein